MWWRQLMTVFEVVKLLLSDFSISAPETCCFRCCTPKWIHPAPSLLSGDQQIFWECATQTSNFSATPLGTTSNFQLIAKLIQFTGIDSLGNPLLHFSIPSTGEYLLLCNQGAFPKFSAFSSEQFIGRIYSLGNHPLKQMDADNKISIVFTGAMLKLQFNLYLRKYYNFSKYHKFIRPSLEALCLENRFANF